MRRMQTDDTVSHIYSTSQWKTECYAMKLGVFIVLVLRSHGME